MSRVDTFVYVEITVFHFSQYVHAKSSKCNNRHSNLPVALNWPRFSGLLLTSGLEKKTLELVYSKLHSCKSSVYFPVFSFLNEDINATWSGRYTLNSRIWESFPCPKSSHSFTNLVIPLNLGFFRLSGHFESHESKQSHTFLGYRNRWRWWTENLHDSLMNGINRFAFLSLQLRICIRSHPFLPPDLPIQHPQYIPTLIFDPLTSQFGWWQRILNCEVDLSLVQIYPKLVKVRYLCLKRVWLHAKRRWLPRWGLLVVKFSTSLCVTVC
jgi:hypothetical protein